MAGSSTGPDGLPAGDGGEGGEAYARFQEGSRLHSLLNVEPPKSNAEIVEELFLATLARFPTKAELEFGVRLLAEHHAQGAEDFRDLGCCPRTRWVIAHPTIGCVW